MTTAEAVGVLSAGPGSRGLRQQHIVILLVAMRVSSWRFALVASDV